MKRLLYIIIFISIICLALYNSTLADVDEILGISTFDEFLGIGTFDEALGQTVSGVVCDDCSGTLKFAWHMEDDDSTPDVTIGNPCGCSDGDTVGAETGAPSFDAVTKSDGTYSLLINALSEYYTFDISGVDLFDIDDFKVTFDLYIGSFAGAGEWVYGWMAIYDVNNKASVYINTTQVCGYHCGAAACNSVCINGLATSTWHSCTYEGKDGVDGNDHKLVCGVTTQEEDDDLGTAANDADYFHFGSYGGSGSPTVNFQIDNVKSYPSDY